MAYGIILFIFFTLCCVVHGQGENCEIAVSGGQGQCKSIFKCQTLLSIVNKVAKTVQDKSLLKRSHCGIDDDAPAVCCPIQKALRCITPEGRPGECINLYSCPNILKLLTPPLSREKLQFVEKSKCNNTDKYSVCCGPIPNFNNVRTVLEQSQNCAPTAFPPNPSSECCGVDSRLNLKIGAAAGESATIYQYPWLALIQYDTFNLLQWQFSGALISGKYVLTAAKAVAHATRRNGIPVNIRLGEYNIQNLGPDCNPIRGGSVECNDAPVTIPIEKTIAHPQYNAKERINDIALIRMSRTAPYTDFIRPICLPTADITQRSDDFKLTAAGWGTSGLWPLTSDIKLQADVSYVERNVLIPKPSRNLSPTIFLLSHGYLQPHENHLPSSYSIGVEDGCSAGFNTHTAPWQCQDLYSKQSSSITLGGGQFCVRNMQGEESCKGDNVLMYKNGTIYEYTGIMNFGAIPCQQLVPTVYTNVYAYVAWIRETIVP